MQKKIYFDTDCFHHFATTYASHPLPSDLQKVIVLSPITMMEALSHLARHWGATVHEQFRGMKNWLDTSYTLVLPFMDDAISMIGFGATGSNGEYTKNLKADLNTIIHSDLADLKDVAEKYDSKIQTIKAEYAGLFGEELTKLRQRGLTEKNFNDLWLPRFRKENDRAIRPRTDEEILKIFSALHEHEYEKLKVAVANEDYNSMNHVNDLFDAEQLIYLGDENLHFITVDRGYLNKVKVSPQRTRIHQVKGTQLSDCATAEALLRNIIL